jgi:hypothetical protein
VSRGRGWFFYIAFFLLATGMIGSTIFVFETS